MTKVFKIIGGGQRVRQNSESGLKTKVVQEESNLPGITECIGGDSFTNLMWATDIKTLQRWANEWAGKEIEFEITEEEEYI